MDDIARRLRRLRELHGLSQRQLARRSGVSNATISLIEHGKTNPSMGLLKSLLEAIPMSVAEFFTLDLEVESRVFYRADELLEMANGSVLYRQVGADMHGRSLQMVLERYPPGADTGRQPLRHESEEVGIILEGHIEATVGDKTRVLGPGDAYQFDSRIPHRFRNVGKVDCVLVSACTPPSF